MKKEANDKSQAIYREDTSNYETSLTVKRLLAPVLASAAKTMSTLAELESEFRAPAE